MKEQGVQSFQHICDLSSSSYSIACRSQGQNVERVTLSNSLLLTNKPKLISSLNRTWKETCSQTQTNTDRRIVSCSPKLQLRVSRPEFFRPEQKTLLSLNRPSRLSLNRTVSNSSSKEYHWTRGEDDSSENLDCHRDAYEHSLPKKIEADVIKPQQIGFFQFSKRSRNTLSKTENLAPPSNPVWHKTRHKTEYDLGSKTLTQGISLQQVSSYKADKTLISGDPNQGKPLSGLQEAFRLLMNKELEGYIQLDMCGPRQQHSSPPEKCLRDLNIDSTSSKVLRFHTKQLNTSPSVSTKSILVKNRISRDSNSQKSPFSPKKKVEFAKNKLVLLFEPSS